MKSTQRFALSVLVATSAMAAQAGVSPEEAKALGTTLTPIGGEKAGQQGRHDPRMDRRPDHASRRLQGRRRHPRPIPSRPRSRAW